MSKEIELNDEKPKRKPRKKRATTKNTQAKKTKPKKDEGLGDKVEKFTKATGIKKVVDIFSEVTGIDCGCDERKEKLNRMFKRKSLKPNCLTKKQYDQITEVLGGIRRKIDPSTQRKIAKHYSDVFGTRYDVWCDSCPEVWKSKIADLQGVLDLYQKELELN